MQSLWRDEEAAAYKGELGLRVYTSRLLGRDPALVLHGGGNTSVKITEPDILGQPQPLLYVKGSGWDLAHIEEAGFSPVDLEHLKALAQLPELSDPEMVNQLRTHMTRASAPTPSVEAILHAVLPYKYVDHTHADAVVTITNTPGGEDRVRQLYGQRAVIIPYVMPGFDLARVVAEEIPRQAGPETIGMVLLNHGVFSFGETAQAAYERMIELVSLAEDYLATHQAWDVTPPAVQLPRAPQRQALATLRAELSAAAGRPMILSQSTEPKAWAFARRDDLDTLSQQGPATPDHVIRTKRLPLVGRDIQAYAEAYRAYFETYASRAREQKTMLDPAPRVLLDPALGLCTAGRTAADAAAVRDIYHHTIDIILRATALAGYQALPAEDIFDVEYWDLEQAKLRKGGQPPMFTGEVAIVTGAASGIGHACVEAFLAHGAAVVGLDKEESVVNLDPRPSYLGVTCDITDGEAVTRALEDAVRTFGGIDMAVLNAGIFPAGRRTEELSDREWRQVMEINLDANLRLLRELHGLLKCAPNNGRVVIMGSKNVPAPGPGAAAYSASKAALSQLARVTALEWGSDQIRINTLHPNAVFDTALWTPDVLAARAAHYGLDVETYKRRNVLSVEVTSQDVGELAAAMAGPLFAKTTGAQLPVDGGNERVI